MAAPRPYWKGYLGLSLVTLAIELYPALAPSTRLAMHQIHRPTGKRIRYEKTVPSLGPVESSEITRGIEVSDDRYVIIEPEEIEKIKIESKHTINLGQFVDISEVDSRYFDRPFYVVPATDASLEGFQIVRAALRAENKLGLGQLAMRGQEYLISIRPFDHGMLLETLRYADEIRDSKPLFKDLPGDKGLDKEKVELARRLIKDKTSSFNPAAFHDTYHDALKALIERKRGKAVEIPEEEAPRRPAEVIDLMEALKKSVRGGKRQAETRPAATRTRQAARQAKPRGKASSVGKKQSRAG